MRTYTTCATCGTELEVLRYRQDHHDTCAEPTDPIHTLERNLLLAATLGDDASADALVDQIDAYDQREPNLLGAALAYAAWGWPVFPCRPGRKVPAIARARGGQGLHDATTDPELIRRWWNQWPYANVGLSTGHAFDVLDIDPAGLRWWSAVRAHLDLAGHAQAGTPRGGIHVYLQPSSGGNLSGLTPGVDYRGLGGYVVAPPSILVASALKPPRPSWPLRYRWLVHPSPTLTHASVAS